MNKEPALEPKREFRGVWVASVANIDWPSKPGLSTVSQKTELLSLLDKAKEVGLNAVIFQVRPVGDALYASRLEPWSEYLTGQQGRAPSPLWDPLQFAVEEAHKRGLELHAWCNPFRARHSTQKGSLASNHIASKYPQVVKSYGRNLWMDPGEAAVQEHTQNVMLDIARRYPVDGIHIDDYFYPYPERNADKAIIDFPDEPSWKAYLARGGKLSKADWRRRNVNQFVESFYQKLKKIKPNIQFGISPFGVYRPGVPRGIEAGLDQVAQLYADPKLWLEKGWCDYLAPQLYWPIDQKPQSFPVLLDWWLLQNPKRVAIYPGLYSSQLSSGRPEWSASEIINQIRLSRQLGANGHIHFSMKALSRNYGDLNQALRQAYFQAE